MRDLGHFGGRLQRLAYGINDAGQVAGTSLTAEGLSHAFITGPDGMGMRDLGTLGGTSYSMLLASTTPGRWWVVSARLEALDMLSSPAPTGWV